MKNGNANNKRVLIAAGGTGGHVFPALAVADELCKRGSIVEWLGAGGMEMAVIAQREMALHVAPFSAPRGLGGVFKLAVAVLQAWRICRRQRPSVVLGMGGYASAPGGLAAKLAGIPLVVHEQNAVAGRANRLLGKIANRVLCGFPDVLPGGEWVGNPVRSTFCRSPSSRDIESPPKNLLVLGGSQGARILNQQVPLALAQLQQENANQNQINSNQAGYAIVHQCGRGHADETAMAYKNAGYRVQLLASDATAAHTETDNNERVAIIGEFMDDVAARMAAADLVICRAGAATLAELAAAAMPALLVPYPHAAGDHQKQNAHFFGDKGAAFVCEESQLSAAWLANFLRQLTPSMLATTAASVHDLSRPQAAADVAAACLQAAGFADDASDKELTAIDRTRNEAAARTENNHAS